MNKVLAFLAISLLASTIASPAMAGSSPILTTQQWVEIMNQTPTPGIGCWGASFPNLVWISAPCDGSYQPTPLVVGAGSDYNASSINYPMTGATGSFTSETGYTSESDSSKGTGWYSLQLNTNTFSITFGGNPTTGWEQFAFQNQGASNYNGYIFIEFVLVNYAIKYGSCPSGWTSDLGSCYLSSPTGSYGYVNPSGLNQYTLTGQVTSTTDTSKICYVPNGNCLASTDSDRLGLHNSNWWSTEYNVLGFGGGSQANFNTGFTLNVKVNNFETGQSCGSKDFTGETNNLNLNAGSCTGGQTSQYVTFVESD